MGKGEYNALLVSRWFALFWYVILFLFGAFYSLAFPNSNWAFAAWIGLIPLYLSVLNKKKSTALWSGLSWGFGWGIFSFFWLGKIEFFIPFIIPIIIAWFPALWALSVPILRKYFLVSTAEQLEGFEKIQKVYSCKKNHINKILLAFSLASFWVLLDWVRSWIFTGLPWNFPGSTQWQFLPMIQIASITGVYGITFIIVFFNVSLAETLLALYHSFKTKKLYVPIVIYIAIAFAGLNIIYGINRIKTINNVDNKNSTIFEAGMVEGDIPQSRYYSSKEANLALSVYFSLSNELLQKYKPDLLIWPESAIPQPLRGEGELCSIYRNKLHKMISEYHVPVLLGTIDFDFDYIGKDENIPIYNSALLIDKYGDVVAQYNKMHLVPWGEYTPLSGYYPFKWFYPWIKKTFGMGRSLTPGKKNTIFKLKDGINAAVLICFEDVFPYVSREHVLKGANLLITITNDAWFPNSSESAQHLQQAVFRSVETQRPMLRCGNNNGTCFIEPDGRISDSLFKISMDGKTVLQPEKTGRAAGIFNVNIPNNPPLTFYTLYGNIFVFICSIIFILGVIWCFLKWIEKKRILLKTINGENNE